MAIERIYNIPLRHEWLKAPKYKRAKKAATAVKQFLIKNMKAESENVKLGRYLNLKLWERGIKYPPHHIKVKVTKEDSGKVYAELIDAPVQKKETVEEKVKKAEKKTEEKAEKQAADEGEIKDAEIVKEEKSKTVKKASPEKKVAAKKAEKKE